MDYLGNYDYLYHGFVHYWSGFLLRAGKKIEGEIGHDFQTRYCKNKVFGKMVEIDFETFLDKVPIDHVYQNDEPKEILVSLIENWLVCLELHRQKGWKSWAARRRAEHDWFVHCEKIFPESLPTRLEEIIGIKK